MDKQFVSPIVTTVENDQTVRMTLDSKKIQNIKCQINIKLLQDNIPQKEKPNGEANTLLSTRDLRCAFSQKHSGLAKQRKMHHRRLCQKDLSISK